MRFTAKEFKAEVRREQGIGEDAPKARRGNL
jgi:hypothetical protein